jgi:murein L,D-transpeptidase YcbB/YkuD
MSPLSKWIGYFRMTASMNLPQRHPDGSLHSRPKLSRKAVPRLYSSPFRRTHLAKDPDRGDLRPPGCEEIPDTGDARVPAIRRRLQMLGDLVDGQLEGDRFDEQLAAAVAGFQKRHGLKADSILGNQTLAAMNVSLAARIQQIELNLERWRWIPHDLGARHLLVNIADYSLTVVDAGWPVMEMRVVVGRNYRRTPVFSDTLKYIVINPYWYVPASIAVKDFLPKIKKDKDYLRRNEFTLFAGWQKDAPQIDPADVDWSQITPADFRYRLRQDPGPKNALGRIKFMLIFI